MCVYGYSFHVFFIKASSPKEGVDDDEEEEGGEELETELLRFSLPRFCPDFPAR